MAEIVNLRLARKAHKREANAAQAEASRARHGMTKAERRQIDAAASRLARTLDGARREPD